MSDAVVEKLEKLEVSEKEKVEAQADEGDEGEDAQADEENDDVEGGEESKKKKKKKNKKKKKKKKGCADIWAMPDDEFNAMCAKWLEETKDQVEGLTEEQKQTPDPRFAGYTFTGNLRPWHVTKQMKVPEGIPLPEYHETGDPVSERELKASRSSTIPLHTEDQIAKLRHVCRIGREVLDIAGRFLKAGVTGDEIDRVVFKACIERGAYPSPLNYVNFPKSLCVSVNEVICHGIPDCRPIQEGDLVNLDISVFKDGFHADLNETFMIGKCDESANQLMEAAYESLRAAMPVIMPNSLYREIGNEVSKVAHKAGFQVTRTYSGHGVGENFHQAPNVSHCSKNKGIGIMRPSHTFTIEPMINEKGWQDVLWPDNWTAVTRDGHRSVQFEHTFLVTETGVEILTARPGTNPLEMPPYDPKMFSR